MQDTLTKLKTLHAQLEEFASSTWTSAAPYDSSWGRANADDITDGLPEAYTIRNWRLASTYCSCVAVKLMVSREILRLLNHTGAPLESQDYCLATERDIDRGITELVRALPSQIGQPPHTLGMICSLSQLKTASALLAQRGRRREADWCRRMTNEIQERGIC